MKPLIAIVGEAWGAEEERERSPFVGSSGWLLTQLLNEAGIRRADCFLTNVFNLRPVPTNDIDNLCTDRAQGIPGTPPLKPGRYIKNQYSPELVRCASELRQVQPNIIVAAGGTASWFLLGQSTIGKLRGAIFASSFGKVLPIYHPAAILRQWNWRHVTVLDLIKAERESHFPEVIRPERTLWIEPTLEDLDLFYENHIRDCTHLSIDIETAGEQITCVGFAPSLQLAIVVPFVDNRRAKGSYWPSHNAEVQAWRFVRRCLEHSSKKTFQNGMYDIAFFWRSYGLRVMNADEDTMLLHHALHPEIPKALDFLGSVYTNEARWKLIRPRVSKTIKRDE